MIWTSTYIALAIMLVGVIIIGRMALHNHRLREKFFADCEKSLEDNLDRH